ncbi:MarR family transcriptional regulator [Streptomyces sp. NRRL F-5123]|uniref:MarR family transcriptional regulator n=1 Tax=Streptomyces sp. NRRL F-5123 TaxID=1463856 RepID=UPI000AFBA8C4|nr:MarR family transcriptional regulator [Streptomyces sp. NRRL F-5123]
MTTGPILDPRVLGRAETAHRALMEAVLGEAGASHQQWIALNISTLGRAELDRDRLVARLSIATKTDRHVAGAVVAEMLAAGLLVALPGASCPVRATAEGLALQRRIRDVFDEAIDRLYLGIPAEDLSVTSRTLVEVTARIDAELMERPAVPRPRRRLPRGGRPVPPGGLS